MAGETLSFEEQPKPKLPPLDLVIDFGEPVSGFAEPMPPERRAWYAERVAGAVRLQWGPNMGDILRHSYDNQER